MLDTYKQLIANQFEAVFCKLNTCIGRCPEAAWNAPVGNNALCQVAFHTLFFADLYLGHDEESFRAQPFHRANESFFAEYEELEDREPLALYERGPVRAYLAHCRGKASQVVAAETADALRARCGFGWLPFSRAELHVYNIRHVQHHAAQLSLRLRLDFQENIPWFKSGWRDL